MFRRREDPRIAELQNENAKLKSDIARYVAWFDQVQSSAKKCSASVDFLAMNAFSIERITREDGPCTIVGYRPNNDPSEKVKEWYIYCDDNVHENLVKQFNQVKGL